MTDATTPGTRRRPSPPNEVEGMLEDAATVLHEATVLSPSLLDAAELDLGGDADEADDAEDALDVEREAEARTLVRPEPVAPEDAATPEELEEELEGAPPAPETSLHEEDELLEALHDEGDDVPAGDIDTDADIDAATDEDRDDIGG